jgi:hypothetical protein
MNKLNLECNNSLASRLAWKNSKKLKKTFIFYPLYLNYKNKQKNSRKDVCCIICILTKAVCCSKTDGRLDSLGKKRKRKTKDASW